MEVLVVNIFVVQRGIWMLKWSNKHLNLWTFIQPCLKPNCVLAAIAFLWCYNSAYVHDQPAAMHRLYAWQWNSSLKVTTAGKHCARKGCVYNFCVILRHYLFGFATGATDFICSPPGYSFPSIIRSLKLPRLWCFRAPYKISGNKDLHSVKENKLHN